MLVRFGGGGEGVLWLLTRDPHSSSRRTVPSWFRVTGGIPLRLVGVRVLATV